MNKWLIEKITNWFKKNLIFFTIFISYINKRLVLFLFNSLLSLILSLLFSKMKSIKKKFILKKYIN